MLKKVFLSLSILCILTSCKKNPQAQGEAVYEASPKTWDTKVSKTKFIDAVNQWKKPDLPNEQYGCAAFLILQYYDQFEANFPALGNIINLLGQASHFDFYETDFDNDGNIRTDAPTLEAIYDEKGVRIGFAPTGLACSVMYRVTYEEYEEYEGQPFHPQQSLKRIRSHNSTFLFTGAVIEDETIGNLKEAAEALIVENSTEGDWYKLIFELHPGDIDIDVPEVYLGPCSTKIGLVDIIGKGLAKVHYYIEGMHTLYCDSWWLQTNNKWERIPADQGISFLIESNKNSSKMHLESVISHIKPAEFFTTMNYKR